MTLQDYLHDPCGKLSIPYWKAATVQVPPQMRIVHDRDFVAADFADYADEPYFRLRHDLRHIPPAQGDFCCRVAQESDLPLLAELINASYTDLSVTIGQLQQYRETPVFSPDLWIIASDATTGEPVGCGMADFDPVAREGALEWIQVLPGHRRRGAGQYIVCELLRRMASRADLTTVSGRVNSAASPEALYRRCGFTGGDVWHILTRK